VSVSGAISLSTLHEARVSVARGLEKFGLMNHSSDSIEDFIDAAIIGLNQTSEGQVRLFRMHNRLRNLAIFFELLGISARLGQRIIGNNIPFSVVSWGFLLGLPDDTRLAYDFHQETSYMEGAEDILNVHFPFLRASSVENGTMSALEGSHKEGVLPYRRSKASDNSYTNMVPSDIAALRSRYREVFFHLELGDIAFFHKDLIHRSNPNLSDALRPPAVFRLTQDLEYSFGGD